MYSIKDAIDTFKPFWSKKFASNIEAEVEEVEGIVFYKRPFKTNALNFLLEYIDCDCIIIAQDDIESLTSESEIYVIARAADVYQSWKVHNIASTLGSTYMYLRGIDSNDVFSFVDGISTQEVGVVM